MLCYGGSLSFFLRNGCGGLEKPVVFPDGQEVDILIGLAATSSDIHNEEAIPQIVMLFDDEAAFEKIRKAESTDEIIGLLK